MSTPALTTNFPLSVVVDGIISYLHFVFGNPDMIPPEYRWDKNDRVSKIRICAPFVIDNEKPMSAPFIVVERGGFGFANRIIDNLRTSNSPTNDTVERVDWMDGNINITCGSGVASEASCLANIVALLIQADRKGICNTLKFVRNLKYAGIGPEIPVVKYAEVHRWEVTVQFFVSLQFGWIHKQMELTPWNKTDIINVHKEMFSNHGQTIKDSDLLIDPSKNFGVTSENDPQLLPAELSKKYYYIRFENNTYKQIYPIAEIVDQHTLRLVTHDENDTEIPWKAPETASNLKYNLLWNRVHIYTKIPGAYS